MVGLLGLASILIAVAIAVMFFRWHGPACLLAWMLLISVAFLNAGFFLNYVRSNWRDSGPAADGLTVTSLGLLAASCSAVVWHAVLSRESSNGRLRTGTNPELPVSADEPSESDQDHADAKLRLTAVLVLGPAWLYFALLGYVPLFQGIRDVMVHGLDGLGSLQAARLARDPYVNAAASYIPLQGLWETFRNFGAPLVFGYGLLQVVRLGRSRTRTWVLVLAVITSLAAGQRWPLMYVILAGIIALGVSGRNVPKRILRNLVVGGILGGVTLSALQARTSESLTSFVAAAGFGFGNLVERILFGQMTVPAASYGPSGESLRDLGGASYWMSARAYLPGSGESFPVVFHQTIMGNHQGFTASPDLYTEAYINFGLVGVVIIPAIVAFGLVIIDLYPGGSIERDAIKVAWVAVFAFVSYRSPIAQISVVIPVVMASLAFTLADRARKVKGIRSRRVVDLGPTPRLRR